MQLRVLITGAGGQLGHDLVDVFSSRAPAGGLHRTASLSSLVLGMPWDVVAADRAHLDVTARSTVLAAVDGVRPHVIVHAGAWTAVDACEEDPDRAFAVNAVGTRHVAEAARRFGAHLVYLSTDYVFDGRAERPYVEWDPVNPLSVYGRSKLGGESELDAGSTIVRTSWVCGAHGSNMVRLALRLAGQPGPLRFVDDQHGCPTFTADLALMVRLLASERLPGVYHVTNQGATTWYELVRMVLALAGHDPSRVEPIATAELEPPRRGPRPFFSVLDNAGLRLAGMPLLPDWHDGLERLLLALGAPAGGVR